MPKLSDTQSILLTAAAQRPDGNLLPLARLAAGWCRDQGGRRAARPRAGRGADRGEHRQGRPRAQHALAQCRRRTRHPAADHAGRSRRARHRAGGVAGGRAPAAARSGPHRLTEPRGVPWARRRPKAPQRVTQRRCGARPARAPSRRRWWHARPRRGRHDRRDRRGDRLAAAHGARRLRRRAEEAARTDDRRPRRSRVAAGSTGSLAERAASFAVDGTVLAVRELWLADQSGVRSGSCITRRTLFTRQWGRRFSRHRRQLFTRCRRGHPHMATGVAQSPSNCLVETARGCRPLARCSSARYGETGQ